MRTTDPVPERTDLFRVSAALSTFAAGLTRGLTMLDRGIPRVAIELHFQVTDAAGSDAAKRHYTDLLADKLGAAPVESTDPGLIIAEVSEGPVLCRVYTTVRTQQVADLEAEVRRLRAQLGRSVELPEPGGVSPANEAWVEEARAKAITKEA